MPGPAESARLKMSPITIHVRQSAEHIGRDTTQACPSRRALKTVLMLPTACTMLDDVGAGRDGTRSSQKRPKHPLIGRSARPSAGAAPGSRRPAADRPFPTSDRAPPQTAQPFQ